MGVQKNADDKKLLEHFQQLKKQLSTERTELAQPASKKLKKLIEEADREVGNIKTVTVANADSDFLLQSSFIGKEKTQALSLSGMCFSPEDFVDLFCRRKQDRISTFEALQTQDGKNAGTENTMQEDKAKEDQERENSRAAEDTSPAMASSISMQSNRAAVAVVRDVFTVRESVQGRQQQTKTQATAAAESTGNACRENKESNIEDTQDAHEKEPIKEQKENQIHQQDERRRQQEEGDAAVRIFEIYKRLKEVQPIPLLLFAADPESFSNTVENLYYISFLVKDDKAVLAENDQESFDLFQTVLEIPGLARTGQSNTQFQRRESMGRGTEHNTEQHMILQLTQQDWSRIVADSRVHEAVIRRR